MNRQKQVLCEYYAEIFDMECKEVKHTKHIPKKCHVVLAVDVGGTHSNFGVFTKDLQFLVSFHYASEEIKNFSSQVKKVIEFVRDKYGWKVTNCCIAAAGVVQRSGTYLKPTNLHWSIDTKSIQKVTKLHSVRLINDFEAIAYGITQLPKRSIVQVKSGQPEKNATKAIIGAGTGLGKAILRHDGKDYIPIASEGGHGDFAPFTEEEFSLAQWISKQEKRPAEWEDVLSGPGTAKLYKYFEKNKKILLTAKGKEIRKSGYDPNTITVCADKLCTMTFDYFVRFYARCAKNFALDTLALGGLYIAGGIAAKHLQIFKSKTFKEEFINNGKMKKLLQKIPVYVIADYNVSLYGAALGSLKKK